MIAGFGKSQEGVPSSFGASVKYIARLGELKEGQEPALAVWAHNVASVETAGIEMDLLGARSRSEDKLRFFTASWSPGEVPTIEQAKDAAAIYAERLGWQGLQVVWSLQNDGKGQLYHLHAVANLVDPLTENIRLAPETGKDVRWNEKLKCRAASREIEFEQGWERADSRTNREKAREARERGLTVAELRDLERPQQLLAALTTHEVAFSKSDAQAMVMDRVRDKGKHAATLEAVMAQAVPLRHKQTGDERYTTQAVIDAHRELDEAYRGLASDRIRAVATKAPAGLTPQQQEAFLDATRAGGKLRVTTGVPGAGKTFLIDSVADAYRSAGYRVRAVSVANSAVDVLRTDTNVPARSAFGEIKAWERDDRKRLGPKDLLIIDEASTLGVEWGRDLVKEARARGAVVWETGDDKQFQAVAYGDALGMAREIEPGVDMKTAVRQTVGWQARATEDLRAGRVREALSAYNRAGHIHRHVTQADARAAIVAEWKDIERGGIDREGVECGVETMTNLERMALNVPLRAAHGDLGRLHGPEALLETMDGPTPYRAGDRVIIRANIREAELHNGSVATVRKVKGSVLFVERRDGKTVPIDTRSEKGSQIQHAYAYTEYREQGSKRYAELHMVDSLVHQRSLTVGMTRHTHRYSMHYSGEKVGSFENLVAFGERERNKTSLDDFTVRDLVAEQREVELAKTRYMTPDPPRRSVESPQERTRTFTIATDALERHRAAEEERAMKIEPPKRARGRGR
jgi:hypothetical protein